jgi:hypothetical protein
MHERKPGNSSAADHRLAGRRGGCTKRRLTENRSG